MIVFTAPSEVPSGFGRSIAAIGKFDGVHLGHRAIIDRARRRASGSGRKVVAVTFDRNPLHTLRPGACAADLIGPAQKLRLLEDAGVDATLMLPFDETLAAMEAHRFVTAVLVDALRVDSVLVGGDFRFGRGGVGDPSLLSDMGESLGFAVDVVDDVVLADAGRRVSSTWIRDLLAEGDVEAAARLLGRPPALWGRVADADSRQARRGLVTVQLTTDVLGFVPRPGLYAGSLARRHGARPRGRGQSVLVDIAAPSTRPGHGALRLFVPEGSAAVLRGQAVELSLEAPVRRPVASGHDARSTPPPEEGFVAAARRVSDGDSPKRSRYSAANRPRCVIP